MIFLTCQNSTQEVWTVYLTAFSPVSLSDVRETGETAVLGLSMRAVSFVSPAVVLPAKTELRREDQINPLTRGIGQNFPSEV